MFLNCRLRFIEDPMLVTRCVKGLRGLRYPVRLRELWLRSMQCHILRSTLITAYNLFHGYLNLNLEEFFDEPAGATFMGINSRSISPDFNSHEGKLHLQLERSRRGTDYQPPSPKDHRSMPSRSGSTNAGRLFSQYIVLAKYASTHILDH